MDPAGVWRQLLAEHAMSCDEVAGRMRAEGLTFGGRLLCPFLRPFFLNATDETRVRRAAETLARLGERVAQAALESPSLVAELGLNDGEARLARLEPGYATASTASRADAFILPDSLHFAEYNAESPAGPGLRAAAGRALRPASGHGAVSRAFRRGDASVDRATARGAPRELPGMGRHRSAGRRDRRLAGRADLERVRAACRRVLVPRYFDRRHRSTRPRDSQAAGSSPADGPSIMTDVRWSVGDDLMMMMMMMIGGGINELE